MAIVRVGLIGAGSTGISWVRALLKAGEVGTVTSIYAPEAGGGFIGAAASLMSDTGAQPAGSAEDLIESAATDAVLIASPAHTHLEYVRAALGAGKPVLCSSPLIANPTEADELLELEITSKTPATAGLPLRLRPEITQLKQLATSGKLGNIGMIRLGLGLSTAARSSEWHRNPEFSTGVLGDVGAHLLDLLRFCFGEIERVQKLDAGEQDDLAQYALMVARLRSGSIAHLECSWREKPGEEYFYYEVAGSKGLLEYDSRKEPLLRLSTDLNGSAPLLPDGAEAVQFIRALASGNTQDLPSLAEGARAVQLALNAPDARLSEVL